MRSLGNLAGAIAAVTIIAVVLGILGPSEALGQATPAQGTKAQDEKPPPPAAPSPWSFRLSPYLWLAGIDGKVGVRSNLPSLNVDVGFSDIFDAIDWFPPPVMMSGEVRYGRFGFVSDFIYLGLEDSGGRTRGPISATADVKLNAAIWTFGGSYRVIENDPVTLDLLAGGRVWGMDVKAKLTGPLAVRQGSGNQTWVDPIIGIAGRVELGSGFALQAEGDVGGFGLVSDIDWQVVGTLQYQINDSISMDAGYRYLAVDYKNGGFLFDAALSGPIIGATFRF
ncbi:MAG TPA: hypothetical protein VMV81_10795 [Phycisphaerae bacterium]|nr:hypothetical protein [Phycisphaerae bacterium]